MNTCCSKLEEFVITTNKIPEQHLDESLPLSDSLFLRGQASVTARRPVSTNATEMVFIAAGGLNIMAILIRQLQWPKLESQIEMSHKEYALVMFFDEALVILYCSQSQQLSRKISDLGSPPFPKCISNNIPKGKIKYLILLQQLVIFRGSHLNLQGNHLRTFHS